MNILKNTVEHFVGPGHAGARTKVFRARDQMGEPCVGAGHAREQKCYRGHGPLLRVSSQKFFGHVSLIEAP